jgi:protein SCO1
MNIKEIAVYLTAIFFAIIFFTHCNEKLPLNKDLSKKSYTLVNQDSLEVKFPELIQGYITVIGFIYTHCPDICPMTTHNIVLTEEKLQNEGINDVKFVALSFDPDRDSPDVLKKFAEIRGISFGNWSLLTGNKETVSDLLRRFDVKAFPTDSTLMDDGTWQYSMIHTDRISLIDKNGFLKKNYKGSTININELVEDIKYLGD